MRCSAVLNCEQIQAALSAQLDGEDPGLDPDVVDAHVAGCTQCQAFLEQAALVNRTLNLAALHDQPLAPDLSDSILAGLEPQTRRQAATRSLQTALSRIALVLVGCGWLAGAIVLFIHGISGSEVEQSVELSIVQLAALRSALGFSLFLAAWQPKIVDGLLVLTFALWMFSFGFLGKEVVLGSGSRETMNYLVLLLFTVIALSWSWISSRGWIYFQKLFSALRAQPS